MTELQALVRKPVHSTVYLFATLAIGVAAVYEPAASVIAMAVLLLLVLTLRNPEAVSHVVLLSTAISVNYIVDANVLGIELLSVYKLGILVLLIPCMLQYGLRFKLGYPLAALLAMLLMTFTVSDWFPRLTAGIALKAYIGLAIPFVFLLIRWNAETAKRHIRLICLLPLVSVVVGALLQAAHLYSLLDVEFTGAVRVQGANIAPHLAMLAFLGITVALLELKRDPGFSRFAYATLAVNFAILVATGTRGPLLAMLLLAGYTFFDMSKQYIKGKVMLIVPLFCTVVLLAAATYASWDNMMKRSFERDTGTGIDLSGRTEAWAYFLRGAADSPVTGRGLGAVTVANDGSLYEGFVVPHNEYIRFFFDGGYIGAGLFFLSLLAVFGAVYRVLPARIRKPYVLFLAGFFAYSFTDNTLSTVQFIIPFCWYLNGLHLLSQKERAAEGVVP
ncbi:O-antigen ligase family protein [Paenibacillus cymbidii]|uniref:O-antigen ligase family protein n=1 Tax=Paenibacillus cymbidii TaxID=1639034 RepID=UPI001080A97B|nr:O-antigen ligase family protein [Paenibacillus cymbidii]